MRLAAALLALLAFAGPALADPLCNLQSTLNPIPSSALVLTVGASACTLVTCTGGAALPSNTYAALLTVSAGAINFTDDTSTPATGTTGLGQGLTLNSSAAVCGSQAVTNLTMIQQSGSSTVKVSLYRR